MPELPEAETIVRGLRPHVVGRRIRRIEVLHGDVLRERPRRFADKVRGAVLTGVSRRGKNVLMHLDRGTTIAVNLGMTGRLLPIGPGTGGRVTPTHPAVRFRFEPGSVLVFDDTRRFGTVECLDPAELESRSRRMGPEPLSAVYTSVRLHSGLARSRSPVRSWLLDQRRIAGVGNIYANEALYLARIHPRRPANRISRRESTALHRAIRRVLRRAIDAGGTTLRDYRTAGGEPGGYRPRLHVYDRAGEPCERCSSTIERIVFGNRSAFFCPGCQRPDPEVPDPKASAGA